VCLICRQFQEAAQALYGHIDRLELHVGLQAEAAKPPMPGMLTALYSVTVSYSGQQVLAYVLVTQYLVLSWLMVRLRCSNLAMGLILYAAVVLTRSDRYLTTEMTRK
jgi:hypothetical protein